MKKWIVPLGIFLVAFSFRLWFTAPANIIIGYDQVRDLFAARSITQGDLKIIGPTAGNNPNLHHGVLYWYVIAIPLALFNGNPLGAALMTSFLNALTCVLLYFFAKEVFKSERAGITAGLISSFSVQLVQYSPWLSNPTLTIFSVALFYFALWKFINGKANWLLVLATTLGVSIQFELFFVYLIPIFLLAIFIYKPKLPSKKIIFFSVVLLLASLSTMILTEVLFNFKGVQSILSAGSNVGGSIPFIERVKAYFLIKSDFSMYPTKFTLNFGRFVWYSALIFFTVRTIVKRKDKKILKRNTFIFIYLFSSIVMIILGFHNAPWFLIGRPAASILLLSGGFSILKKSLSIPLLTLLLVINITNLAEIRGSHETFLDPDQSAILSRQLEVIDFTYREAKGEHFSVGAVTNPLYINSPWGYNYNWYGREKGQLPNWADGDQLPPFDTLPKSDNTEKIRFLITDTSSRIPAFYKEQAIKSASEKRTLEKTFEVPGIKVYKFVK